MSTKYAYSADEERYTGPYDSQIEAAATGFIDEEDSDEIYVGEIVPPTPPENLVDASTLIEAVQNNEDYLGEWAEEWPDANKDRVQELTYAVRKVFATWLDEHNLRPTHFTVENVKQFTREEVDAVGREGGAR